MYKNIWLFSFLCIFCVLRKGGGGGGKFHTLNATFFKSKSDFGQKCITICRFYVPFQLLFKKAHFQPIEAPLMQYPISPKCKKFLPQIFRIFCWFVANLSQILAKKKGEKLRLQVISPFYTFFLVSLAFISLEHFA